ncbi:hypothetical protein PHYSODRAFT_504486 [Plasmopara halstedii]|uniref:Uncharacterized protein n=1 Tax=Plasmopara halstedii TaxID=4781 RepID=A0A0P1B025_PLAHL|nr:hypothetical protein PHYSODRAFT_504486 [Plasmopara halstedii]CEG47705.1 hypothetical protein PHYSODRAFT_504486 [Plasmopara halstedii]|eukprot:XP_024584074.1 hypothetical protein PHYSODRAFT_504486 [Plasmopara halstedii]
MNKYFARQFDNLLLPRTSRCLLRPCYIQCVFSSLHSSSVRYKLRILFLESEDFGKNTDGSTVLKNRVLLDENGHSAVRTSGFWSSDS